MVFVPYRGLIFLNSKKDFVGELQEVFPSPTGDLYFSIPFETPYTAKTRFPSPTGDLYFSIVPVLTSHAGLNPFPSPTGDLYFSIVHVKSEITDFPSFPSPTGDLYFSILLALMATLNNSLTVSVPYRGLIFLNKRKQLL